MPVIDQRIGAPGHRVERRHRQARRDEAAQLGRAQIRGSGSGADRTSPSSERRGGRRVPDPPRVEQLKRGREDLGALEEEGPLLRIERLEGRQVQDHLVGLDLSEVGVDGGVERERRGQPDLEVGARCSARRKPVERRLVRREWSSRRITYGTIWTAASRSARRARRARRSTRPRRGQCAARRPTRRSPAGAAGIAAPGSRTASSAVVAERAQRDGELGRPAALVARRLAGPHAVPVAAEVGVVEAHAVEPARRRR